ncbi:MAG: hypothetical protein JSU94_07000 [Phycisphaerales bacterium]|nr:MAG: hypothetical protein JSU94_07000 [Phycisphaerales bacterium]
MKSSDCLLVVLMPILVVVNVCTGSQKVDHAKPAKAVTTRYNAHCGLHCMYFLLKLQRSTVTFDDLLVPAYITSWKGSSIRDLKRAAEDHCMYAVPFENFTTAELKSSPYPLILHVKPRIDSEEYDHFELYLGARAGKAELFDPPEPITLFPFADVAPRWDGTGLVVSPHPIDLGDIVAPTRKRFMLYATLAVATVLVIRWVSRRWVTQKAPVSRTRVYAVSLAQAGAFALVAVFVGITFNVVHDEGLLANPNTVQSIKLAHRGDFIPKVSTKHVRRLLGADTVFIDARFAQDFDQGHLEKAISIPVDANDAFRKRALARLPKNARIVVYCQSVACRFAERVAAKLLDDGFSNVSIYRAGWREWIAKYPTLAATGDTAAQTPGPNTPAQDTSAATDPSQDAS